MINEIFSTQIGDALGLTLLHSLWQAALIAGALFLSFSFLSKISARTRYYMASGSLLAILGTSIATFFYLYDNATESPAAFTLENTISLKGNEAIVTSAQSSGFDVFTAYFSQHLPLITSIWLIGLSFFILRMLGGLAYVNYLKNNKVRPVTDYWQAQTDKLCHLIPVKKSVKVLESTLVKTPMTIGWLSPVILLPIGLVNQLTLEETKAILAHELAHIARQDYIFNLLQSFIETLFYFNPAVWLISAHIRQERENCCDDIAVRVCGNSLDYVKALVQVQEAGQTTPHLAMAFSRKKSNLLARVQRILKQPNQKSSLTEKLISGIFILGIITLFAFQNQPAPHNLSQDKSVTSVTTLAIDTIPLPKKNTQMRLKSDKDDISVKIENNEIVRLEIDGKVIPKEDYPKYETKVSEMIENLPEPPAPPSPPAIAPPTPPKAPAPPKGIKGDLSDEGTSKIKIIIDRKDVLSEEELSEILEENMVEKTIQRLEIQKEQLENAEVMAEANKLLQEELIVLKEVEKEMLENQKYALEQAEYGLAQAKKAMGGDRKIENIEKELKSDGLYNKGVYRFKLSNKQLKINGKKQSKDMYQKYKKICEAYYEGAGTDYGFEIRRNKKEQKHSLSIIEQSKSE